ncbi:MAG: rhomboid family intramembrane serine protease [Flavobacteriaceae bacterium]|nr:MAG: rhomboid family intramembrane serine protease [Flavobacteriaceae bacterium]
MTNGGLKYQFAKLNIAEKLIAINVLVFLINGIFIFLLKLPRNMIMQWFELPKEFIEFFAQPWSIVTYSFFHADFWHILYNMLVLHFAGKIVLNLFGPKKFINVYFLGVILGGLFFLLSYNIFPVLLEVNTALIGASAGVTAVLIFVCAYVPNTEVRLFIFNIKLWYIGAFWVLLNLIQIPNNENVGGLIAHLGGALLGYFYARQLTKGKDIGSGFENLLNSFANMFKGKEKKAPLRTVYRKKKTEKKSTVVHEKENNQRKINAILDKISKSGYESLSKSEKDFLFKAGKEN